MNTLEEKTLEVAEDIIRSNGWHQGSMKYRMKTVSLPQAVWTAASFIAKDRAPAVVERIRQEFLRKTDYEFHLDVSVE